MMRQDVDVRVEEDVENGWTWTDTQTFKDTQLEYEKATEGLRN